MHGRVIAPPVRTAHVGQVKGEEDEQRGNDETTIERCRNDVVVLQPPARVSSPDKVVEDDAGETPAQVNVDGRWRQLAGASEDDGRADVAPERLGPAASQQPSGNGRDGSNEPEPLQRCVESSVAEDASGSDGAPDDRGRVEDAATRARIAVFLLLIADVGDVTQSPVHDGNLHDSRPDRGQKLRREHDARGHLHVMAELQILGKIQGLGHGNVAIVLEHHHGQGPAGDHVPNDELG